MLFLVVVYVDADLCHVEVLTAMTSFLFVKTSHRKCFNMSNLAFANKIGPEFLKANRHGHLKLSKASFSGNLNHF